jgi:hypothetical protein
MDQNNNQQPNYNPNAPQGYQPNYNNNNMPPQNYNQGQPQYNPNMQHQQNYNSNAPQGYNNNMPQQNYNPEMQNIHQNQHMGNNMGQQVHQISKNMSAYFETNSYINALENAEFAFIKQKMELLEIITGCETKNRYKVYVRYPDGSNCYLFKAKEDSDCCERLCCRYFI